MLEKDLYKPLIDGAHSESFGVLYRLRDTIRDKKPYDVYGTKADGRSIAIEVKQVDYLDLNKPFPWNLFAEHQKTALMICGKLGGCSLPIIYCCQTKKMYVFDTVDILNHDGFFLGNARQRVLLKKDKKWVGWNKITW
jgi:hypothetical protein